MFKLFLWFYAAIAMIFTAVLTLAPEIRSSMTLEHEVLRIVGLVVFGLLLAKEVVSIAKR